MGFAPFKGVRVRAHTFRAVTLFSRHHLDERHTKLRQRRALRRHRIRRRRIERRPVERRSLDRLGGAMFSRLARRQHRLLVQPPLDLICPCHRNSDVVDTFESGPVSTAEQVRSQSTADNQRRADPPDPSDSLPPPTADQAGTMIDVTA